jgi:hypothetical protein
MKNLFTLSALLIALFASVMANATPVEGLSAVNISGLTRSHFLMAERGTLATGAPSGYKLIWAALKQLIG